MLIDSLKKLPFLTIEEATLLELVLYRFRLLSWRRISWLRHIWSQTLPENESLGAYHQEVDRILLHIDDPTSENMWYKEARKFEELNQELEKIEKRLKDDRNSRPSLLNQILGLDSQEIDLLQTCLAVMMEPQFGRVCAYLQDNVNRPYVTGELIARLYGHGTNLTISSESPLRTWSLIRESEISLGGPIFYTLDPSIFKWLKGHNDLDEKLVGIGFLKQTYEPLSNWPLKDAVNKFTGQIKADPPGPMRLIVSGIPGSGRKTFAAEVAKRLNMLLLVIDCDKGFTGNWEELYMRASRHAFLNHCSLAWVGKNLEGLIWPEYLPPYFIQFAICERGQELKPVPSLKDHRIELPDLSLIETRALWQKLLPSSSRWESEKLDILFQKYEFTIGKIVDIAAQDPSGPCEVENLLHSYTRHLLGDLAQPMETSFRWEDLIVGKFVRQQLLDFAFEARERRNIWDRKEILRLFPQGRGLFALFTGSPGTGKTMAAQVLGAELNLPLFRIDLSSVVSKYVGETSKNLEKILNRAQHMNAILLFDEADALFGKRTEIKDAHDRFANTDTNYLLQAIEQFPGIAILTSNNKSNIDHGFIRRLRYVIDFPRPDARQRTTIWVQLLEEMSGKYSLEQLKPSLELLAENFELTGAQIKLALFSASIKAKRENEELKLEHLLEGVEREWLKEGRGISMELQKVMRKKFSNNNNSTNSEIIQC